MRLPRVDTLTFVDGPESILINSLPLHHLLQQFETPMARAEGHPSLAGDYGPLTPYELYRSIRKAAGHTHPHSAILDCPCGGPGCWTLKLRVHRLPDCVIWSHFKQVHREKWDYSNFGPFRFSRRQYAEQMTILKQRARLSRAQLLKMRAAWREQRRLK